MERLGRVWRERVRGTEPRRVVCDAAVTFSVGAVLLAAGLVDLWPVGLTGVDPWWFVLTLTVMCAVMLAKGRRPLAALGAGLVVLAVDVALGGSMGVQLGLLDLIYFAALRADATAVRRLEVGAGACVAGVTAVAFVATGDLRATVNVTLLAFALIVTPMWWGRSVRQQAELAAFAAARAQDLARIGELRELEVVRAERTRMAGDLHDALASHLSAIAIHAEGALAAPRAAAQDRSAARDQQALSAIRSSSVAALREMRAMIELLRTGDEVLTSPARLGELNALAESFRGQGMELTVRAGIDGPELPAAVDQTAYRIVQESLANALKHGQRGPVDVAVDLADGTLHIDVSNRLSHRKDPDASDQPSRAGVGLLTMRERAEALGGTFAAAPQADRWRVCAVIPVQEET